MKKRKNFSRDENSERYLPERCVYSISIFFIVMMILNYTNKVQWQLQIYKITEKKLITLCTLLTSSCLQKINELVTLIQKIRI